MIEEEGLQIKSQLEQQLIEAILDSLQNHMNQNAIFLAERLVYERDTEEHRSLLAECYLHENQPYKACHILKECKSEFNRYQLAVAYFRNKMYKEGEIALIGPSFSNQFALQSSNIPNGGFGHFLLGQIYEQTHRLDDAKIQYYKSLDLNPTLWMAFERLSKIGEPVTINKVFIDQKQKQYEISRQQSCNIYKIIGNSLKNKSNLTKSGQKEVDDVKEESLIIDNINKRQTQGVKPFSTTGVQTQIIHLDDSSNSQMKFSQPQQKKIGAKMIPTPGIGLQNYQSLLSQPFQLSQNPNKNQNTKKSEIQKVNCVALQSSSSLINLPQLLKQFAHPYQLWTNYSVEAIANFQKLPPHHYRSGWVLEKVARSFMDQVKYTDAEKIWKEMRQIEPTRLEGMDYYSSCLWHLKKQSELTYLAHSCLQISMQAPETWIAIGNCFSLMKEIDNSIKFFGRAIQLRKDYSYAYTLSGHEFSQNENFQQAKKSYDTATSLDQRQYNAWWGQGNMYYKTDKYDDAKKCFIQAIKINPNNPVLPTFLAMSYAAQGNHNEALKYFEQSEKLDPMNGLNKYQKANSLIKLDKYEQALNELQSLSQFIPKETAIYILMGRILKKLNKIKEAQNCFNMAMSLDMKDQAKIKGLMESLSNPNSEFNDDFDL
ncbi:unnamed protein product [Paramecium pentaurelia]|uniref:Uncharacterized protein n=1 Tax=Paramecium pentaurelia TaxID=43138 RepID=A0A8S1Y9Q4_9CILI|nr:unnamed protein product [Paramecium pentaurelia]